MSRSPAPATDWTHLLQDTFAEFDLKRAGKSVLLGIAAGLLAGAGALILWLAVTSGLALLGHAFGVENAHEPSVVGEALSGGARYVWASLAVLGGLFSGVVAWSVSPEVAGGGVDEVIREYHHGEGVIRRRTGWAKLVASTGLIGTGGSAGYEGPAALIGAAFTRFVAKPAGLSVRERRIMMIAGAGAGVGAIFQTPLGGAIFASEVLYAEPEFESEAIVPSLIASIISYSMLRFAVGEHHLFDVPAGLAFEHPLELIPYTVLALVIVIWSWLYTHFYRDVVQRRLFSAVPGPVWLKPALGGVVVAAIIAWQPLIAGGGYHAIDLALAGQFGTGTLLLLALLKLVATSFSIGSGGSGGTFAPTVMIGTFLGASVGTAFAATGLSWSADIPAFAVVGMGGMFAAISNVPLAMIVMTAELTGGYGLLVPMMLVVTLCYIFAPKRLRFHSHQVLNRMHSPAHYGDFVVDVLESIPVGDVMTDRPVRVIPPRMRLDEIMGLVKDTSQNYFPVVGSDGVLAGIFSLDDVRKTLGEEALGLLVVADDLAVRPVIAVTPDETLDSVMRKFTQKNLDELPVVEPGEARFLGMLRRRDVIAAYNNRMYPKGSDQ